MSDIARRLSFEIRAISAERDRVDAKDARILKLETGFRSLSPYLQITRAEILRSDSRSGNN